MNGFFNTRYNPSGHGIVDSGQFLQLFLFPCNMVRRDRVQRIKTNTMNDMKEVLMPITILGSFGAAVYFFTKVMTDYLLRKKMIDKGLVGEDAQSLFKVQEGTTNKYSSLKWGLIVLFAGISLIVMEFLPYYGNSPLPYGLFAVSVSIGFLIYYFVVRAETK